MKPCWGLKTPHLKLSAGDNIFKQVLICTDIKSKNIFFSVLLLFARLYSTEVRSYSHIYVIYKSGFQIFWINTLIEFPYWRTAQNDLYTKACSHSLKEIIVRILQTFLTKHLDRQTLTKIILENTVLNHQRMRNIDMQIKFAYQFQVFQETLKS